MNSVEQPRGPLVNAGYVAAAAIAAFVIYVIAAGLDTTGQHFVVLGALRVVLIGALLAFALAAGAQATRLGRVGLGMAALGAAFYVFGGIGAVATDGWSYDVFASENDGIDPPWYAYVLGLSGFVFALGTVLVGIAGRSAGRLSLAVILAGAMFPLVLGLQDPLGDAGAHLVWLTPWMVLAVGLIAMPGHGLAQPTRARSAAAR